MNNKLPSLKLYNNKLYSAEQCQLLDRLAIEKFAVPSYELMCRAGLAAMNLLRSRWRRANNVVILCGSGNNGGDGLVLARLLKNIGMGVDVFLLVDSAKLQGDALRAYQDALKVGIQPKLCADTAALKTSLQLSSLVVDALLGTGTQGDLRAELVPLVALVNDSDKPVFALDAPTGICADTGKVLGAAIKAELTLSFLAHKPGLLTGEAPEYVGELQLDELGLEAEVFENFLETLARDNAYTSTKESFCFANVSGLISARHKTSHKGSHGHVLLIGGDKGMGGAIALAGRAALRVGAGLVSVACHSDNAAMVTALQPELMCSGISQKSDLEALIKNASVIALGPGLGQSPWSQMIFSKVIEEKKLRVVDADGLNWLANNHHHSENWVLTPHPGEAARLLKCSAKAVNDNRFAASAAIQKHYGGICVLKGAGTLVQGQQSCGVCLEGNPGMASGGMGDVLTGILAGLFAQFEASLSPEQIARLAVSLHSHAADRTAQLQGERGMIASDVIDQLQTLVNVL